VPLEEYKQNLEDIIKHPTIVAHNPRIILVTPPPVDERLQELSDLQNGKALARLAPSTKSYADAAAEVGQKLNVPVLNLWKLFMARANMDIDTWKSDQPLPGSRDIPQNEALVKLMFDGRDIDQPFPTLRLTRIRSAL
jgi:isoamyl acetate esterase